jgi:hypothetical protein
MRAVHDAHAARLAEASPRHAAMLEDRIRSFEGQPQRYGTQFDWDAGGQLSPLPVEDPDDLENRRRSVGLGPLEEEIQVQRQIIRQSGEPKPVDWAARQRDMAEWLREVGWRT